MSEYLIHTAEMNRIFELLNKVLKIRITFFDLQSAEITELNIKERSNFCRYWRQNRQFDELCRQCDRKNLEICKLKHDVHVYHCHAGLLEGIVPLYNQENSYLGAIVFGQLRDRSVQLEAKYQPLANDLPESTELDMYNTGQLLKYLSEYIRKNELITHRFQPWRISLLDYISRNLNKKITLQSAARAVNRSESFLSHNIPGEFGMTLKKLIRKMRMESALKLLESGKQVRECAFVLGYKDEFYFSRDFKKFFGTAPKYMKNSVSDKT